MIAWIDGVMVQGSPEEIEQYKSITSKKKTTSKNFNLIDDVPEHVKKYKEGNTIYVLKESKTRAWF